jgi:uncharacterized repeat protein (TIGR01451 family)
MMNVQTKFRPGRWLTPLALSLLLCLLFLGLTQLQQPAYSQGVELSAVAVSAEATPVRTPCVDSGTPTPVPPGQQVTIIGDDEILLSYRQANDSKALRNVIIDNPDPETNTQLQTQGSQKEWTANSGTFNDTWLASAAADLNGDHKAELVSAFKDANGFLAATSWSELVTVEDNWYNSNSPYSGSNLSWIDVASGDLDRKHDNDELVVAMRDGNQDEDIVVLDGKSTGDIGTADKAALSSYVNSSGEQGNILYTQVATGDLNGDGADDEVVVVFRDGGKDLNVMMFRYTGTGTLQNIWWWDSRDNGRDNTANEGDGAFANGYPLAVTTGDFDRDYKDEVIVAARMGNYSDGAIQLIALDVTSQAADGKLTVDSSVWKDFVSNDTYEWGATYLDLAAGDFDGDSYDEFALIYNVVHWSKCYSVNTPYPCDMRFVQYVATFDYVPTNAADFKSYCGSSATTRCFHQRSGTWHSSENRGGHDDAQEGMVRIAAGDLDRDTMDEVVLAHYRWESDDIEVVAFDADSGLTQRGSSWKTSLGDNRPSHFAISMGDRDGDSQWADFTGTCYLGKEAQIISAIYAPPHYPEWHVAHNNGTAGASFGIEALTGAGTSQESTTSIGSSVKMEKELKGIKGSFTHGWAKEASSEKTKMTDTAGGVDWVTCPSAMPDCAENPSYNGVEFIETVNNCFVYHEATAGNMDVCLPASKSENRFSQNWWYTTGYNDYNDSWVPLGHNLALGRFATQSSQDSGYPSEAGRAVDGDVSGTWSSGHTAHTGMGSLPATSFLTVDLGGVQWIGAVQVWNRTDQWTTRLLDFYVFVSQTPFPTSNDVNALRNSSEVWKRYVPGQAGRPTVIPVNELGRFVRVQQFGPDASPADGYEAGGAGITATTKDYLDIAELQVYGMPGTVDQWPVARPITGTTSFKVIWPDPNATSKQITQTVTGQLLGSELDHAFSSIRAESLTVKSHLGFGQSGETIQSGSTSHEGTLGLELRRSREVSVGTSETNSHILSWGNTIGFYGEIPGLPKGTDSKYNYEVAQYAWKQEDVSSGGLRQAFLVGGWWVPKMGSLAAPGPVAAAEAPSDAPAVKPAPPLISSPTHPDPAAWGGSTAVTDWSQPPGDPVTVAGYNWFLDRNADTIPYETNFGLTTTDTHDQLADGVWTMHVRAVSDGGQWSDTAHRAIRVDTHAPTVELTLDPAQATGDDGWYVTPVTVAASATDGAGSGVASVEFSTDGTTWQPYTGPQTFDQDTFGTTVYARARDIAGLVSEPVTTTLKIDRTLPNSHIAGGDGPGAYVARVMSDALGNEALVLAGAVADDLSQLSGMNLEYDGLGWIVANVGPLQPLPDRPEIKVNWYYTVTDEIGAGNHIFLGQAKDGAGNLEEPYEVARVLWYPRASPEISGSSMMVARTAIRPGEAVAFTVIARNTGWQEAHVSVVDTLPAGLTPVAETLGTDVTYDPAAGTLTWPARLLWPGQWVQHTFQAQAAADLPASTLENRATLHAFWPNTDLLPADQRQEFLDKEQTVTVEASVAVDPGLPAGADRTPPWVILVPSAQQTTDGPEVMLGIPAAQDAARMYVREWTLDPITGKWIVAQNSGWMAYARMTTWTLAAGQGVHYLGVWVADSAGNVSILNELSLPWVNRMDASQSLAAGERVQYRGIAVEGMLIDVTLMTLSGDPDMYVWKPRNGFRPDRYTDASVDPGQVEGLGLTQIQQTGRFLLEVQAVGATSEYELALTGSAPEMARAAAAPAAKERPEHPLAVSDPLSAGQVGPDVTSQQKIYLPVMLRNN